MGSDPQSYLIAMEDAQHRDCRESAAKLQAELTQAREREVALVAALREARCWLPGIGVRPKERGAQLRAVADVDRMINAVVAASPQAIPIREYRLEAALRQIVKFCDPPHVLRLAKDVHVVATQALSGCSDALQNLLDCESKLAHDIGWNAATKLTEQERDELRTQLEEAGKDALDSLACIESHDRMVRRRALEEAAKEAQQKAGICLKTGQRLSADEWKARATWLYELTQARPPRKEQSPPDGVALSMESTRASE